MDVTSLTQRGAESLVARALRGDVIEAVDEDGLAVLTASSYDGSALAAGFDPADDASYDEEPVIADVDADVGGHVAFWLR